MKYVNGLGGAFLFTNQPQRLAEWYRTMFGFEFQEGEGGFYQTLIALNPDNPAEKYDTTFAVLPAQVQFETRQVETEPESMYGDQPFMLNLRTSDLDGLMRHLEANGVKVIKYQDEGYGKFAWVRDPDGNRVELYQPVAQL